MSVATLTRKPAAVTHGGGPRRPYAYNRLSKFRPKDYADVEVTRGVHRQAADAERVADERRLGAVVHITDDGQSASRFATRARDGWPVLLDHIRAGRVSYVLVWLLDRATRQTSELVDLLDACRSTGTLILQTGTGTVIDPDDPDSVALATITGALAEAEVAKMSKRVRRAHAEKATLGQFHGGRRRFGYTADMRHPHPVEAPIVAAIAADIIKGRTLHSISKELTERGIPGPMWKGVPFVVGPWSGSNLGTMMRRPHFAGLRVHGGKIVGPADWPAIIDPETWETMQAVLSAPSRRTSPTSTARKHLLSGLAACAVCGKGLRMHAGGAGPVYQCPDAHVSRAIAPVDAVVVGAIVKTLARPDFGAVWVDEPEHGDRATVEAQIESVESRLEDWADREIAGKATRRQVEKVTADGMAEIAALRATLATMAAARAVPAVLDGIGGNPDAAAIWDGLDLDRRRAIIRAMCDVRLHRAARKGARFDPTTVEISWLFGDESDAIRN